MDIYERERVKGTIVVDTEDDRQIEEFMEAHVPLAYTIAKKHIRKYKRGNIDPMDIQQVALYGLFLAVKRYDWGSGNKFSTYAVPTINGTIMNYIRDLEYDVRIPKEIKSEFLRYKLKVTGGCTDKQMLDNGEYTWEELVEFRRIDLLINKVPLQRRHNPKGCMEETKEYGDVIKIESDEFSEEKMLDALNVQELLDRIEGRLGEDYREIAQYLIEGCNFMTISREMGLDYKEVRRKAKRVGRWMLSCWI